MSDLLVVNWGTGIREGRSGRSPPSAINMILSYALTSSRSAASITPERFLWERS